eukprot:COSAG02_NODE_1184_length_14008_cov_44.301963_4_plen_128_part_00
MPTTYVYLSLTVSSCAEHRRFVHLRAVFCDPEPTNPPQLCPDGSVCGAGPGGCAADDPNNPAPAGHCRCPCSDMYMTGRLQDVFKVCCDAPCPSSFPMISAGELQECPLDVSVHVYTLDVGAGTCNR